MRTSLSLKDLDPAREVLKNHAAFSSRVADFPLLNDDPPRHTALRRRLQPYFTPRRASTVRAQVEGFAAELVDQIPSGVEIDAVEALAAPLPAQVVALLLEVGSDIRDRFVAYIHEVSPSSGGLSVSDRLERLRACREFVRSCIDEERRTDARIGLLDELLGTPDDHAPLTEDEGVSLVMLLLEAGYETTRNLIGSIIGRLLERPERWGRIKRGEVEVPAFIHEVLRLDTPVRFLPRRANSRCQLQGEPMDEGDEVLVSLEHANLDPTQWEDAHEFRGSRVRRPHLSFGLGAHYCLGAPIALMEAEVLLETISHSFSSLTAGQEPPIHRQEAMLRGYRRLPVVFTR